MGRSEEKAMTWTEKYAEERSAREPEFKAGYEEECALLALVRARNAAELTQKDVADALHVSQSYIARVERGSKPMSLSLMLRYANVVGVMVQFTPVQHRASV
jgi:DNA-binding XRE family transcriptional regulator